MPTGIENVPKYAEFLPKDKILHGFNFFAKGGEISPNLVTLVFITTGLVELFSIDLAILMYYELFD